MMNTPKCLRTATLALLCAAAAGCTNHELPDANPNPAPDGTEENLITITATTSASDANAPQTRVAYDDTAVGTGGNALTWEKGDKLNVLAKDATGNLIKDADGKLTVEIYEMTAEPQSGATTATFSGNTIAEAAGYYVYANTVESSAGLTYIGLLNQSAEAGVGDYTVLAAEGNEPDGLTEIQLTGGIGFAMKTAIMKFQLTNLPEELTKITSLTWSTSQADAFVDYTIDGTLRPENKSDAITLTYATYGKSIDALALDAYISFLPFTLAQSETFRVTLRGKDADGNAVAYYQEVAIAADGGVAYKAGCRYTAAMNNTTTTDGWKSIIFNANTVAEDFTAGAGSGVGDSAENPYIISTPGHLKYLVNQVNEEGGGSRNSFEDK